VVEQRTNQRNSEQVTLADLTDTPRWVAWRQEMRRRADGTEHPTKVPYSPHEGLARSNDARTWGTRAQAERRWQQLNIGRSR
jgi:hypothetical protein